MQYINGKTSSSLPGNKGNDGERGVITYFYDAKANIISDSSLLKIKYNDEVFDFYDKIKITPQINDYLIYSTDGTSKNFMITSIDSSSLIDSSILNVDLIGEWNDINYDEEYSEDTFDANNITITCVTKNISIRTLDNKISTSNIKNSSKNTVDAKIITKSKKSTALKNFNVIANDGVLGDYKIELEFTSNNISPHMHSIIASRFTQKNVNFLYNTADIIYIDKNCSYRGYLYNYDRKQTEGSCRQNFDNEKLDNFTMIIKDYEDGLRQKTFNKDVCVPVEIFKDPQTIYTCNIFAYINNYDGTYTKKYIGNIDIDEFLK